MSRSRIDHLSHQPYLSGKKECSYQSGRFFALVMRKETPGRGRARME
jgi:hypothetical protein